MGDRGHEGVHWAAYGGNWNRPFDNHTWTGEAVFAEDGWSAKLNLNPINEPQAQGVGGERVDAAVWTVLRDLEWELKNVREHRCTCPHDYFHGDHHYDQCPGNNEITTAVRRLTTPLNRVAYCVDQLRKALAPVPQPAPPAQETGCAHEWVINPKGYPLMYGSGAPLKWCCRCGSLQLANQTFVPSQQQPYSITVPEVSP